MTCSTLHQNRRDCLSQKQSCSLHLTARAAHEMEGLFCCSLVSSQRDLSRSSLKCQQPQEVRGSLSVFFFSVFFLFRKLWKPHDHPPLSEVPLKISLLTSSISTQLNRQKVSERKHNTSTKAIHTNASWSFRCRWKDHHRRLHQPLLLHSKWQWRADKE